MSPKINLLKISSIAGVGFAALLASCSSDDTATRISSYNPVENEIAGRVIDSTGTAQSGATVYFRGKVFVNSEWRDTTLEATSDSAGNFSFSGSFMGEGYIEVNASDSLGVLQRIIFSGDSLVRADSLVVRNKGFIRVEAGALGAETEVFIPALGVRIKLNSTDTSISAPPGSYTVAVGDSSEKQVVNVEEHSTGIVLPAENCTELDADVIADWEFNDSLYPGKDYSCNGLKAAILDEGAVSIKDSVLVLNGASGMMVPLAKDFLRNSFAVETRVRPTSFAEFDYILSAEPPGRFGDGWVLRLDYGKVHFQVRDSAKGTDWQILETDSAIALNEWTTIRAERSGYTTSLWVNGKLVAQKTIEGDVGQLSYDLGIGYDAMDQANHERYFNGDIDYIRVLKMADTTSAVQDTSWIADWSFDDSAYVDVSGNGHNAMFGEGHVVIKDSALVLDSVSGIRVPLSIAFLRNDFELETRVYPTKFTAMENIVAAEPPGSIGDGWVLRVDGGKVLFQVRDADTHGPDWQILQSDSAIALNEWTTIRAERKDSTTSLWINGKLVAQKNIAGDIGQLKYDLGIGYDAMNQNMHDRYFNGRIDFVRYRGL